MSNSANWANCYARQARADFSTWSFLQGNKDVNECHRLLFLQMACEKLCKAHLISEGTPPESLQTSHGYVAKPLPVVIRNQLLMFKATLKGTDYVLIHVRHLAQEIEILNPAVQRAGQRPDNCEYPWEDANKAVHSPLDWTFNPTQLLLIPAGRTFLKLLEKALNAYI
jgi:hypothetical protein